MSQDESSVDAEHIQYLCPDGMYNPMATFLFNAEGTVIKNFLSKKAVFSYETLLLFFLIWFIFTCITYGTAVPAGLFLPGILIGCSLGRVLGLFIENYIVQEIHPSTYAIIGAAATLAGYSRLSFSLAIIMLETTENVNLFLPIIFALFVSFAIGGIFNKSMYVNAVRSKAFPFLNESVPMCNELITAEQIMTMPAKTLRFRSSIVSINKILTENKFSGFPIVNSENQCIGIINRYALLVIIKNIERIKGVPSKGAQEAYASINSDSNRSSLGAVSESDEIGTTRNEEEDENDMVEKLSPLELDWSDFNVDFHSTCPDVNSKEIQKIAHTHSSKVIDLRPYMVPRPFTVFENDNFQKCLDIFRLMNLRHMPVLAEEDGSIVGMITRQDLFAFMSV